MVTWIMLLQVNFQTSRSIKNKIMTCQPQDSFSEFWLITNEINDLNL